MRTSTLITSYIQATVFLAIGARVILGWERSREPRQAHLALATGLFGANSLISAISQALYDSTKLETPPQALSVLSSTILLVSIFAFFVFLFDFIKLPKWLLGIGGVATAFFIVMNALERREFLFNPNTGRLVPVHGVSNPIAYKTWIGILIAYLAIAFGLLFVSFLIYGVRVRGLARFRMLMITAGFFLLFLVIGLLPRLIYGDPSAETVKNLLNVLRYVALGSGPLLFLGFATPRWISRRFGDRPSEQPNTGAPDTGDGAGASAS